MSEMKMSDVFGLPLVVCRTNPQMITAKPTYNGKTDYYYATIRSPVELEVNYAVHAINNQDRLTEENQKLREALVRIESLSDNLLIKCVESDSDIADSDAWHELERALKFKAEQAK